MLGILLQLAQSQRRSHLRFTCRGLWGSEFRGFCCRRRGNAHSHSSAKYIRYYSLSLAVGVHELFQLSSVFDLKEDFFAVLASLYVYLTLDFEVKLLRVSSGSRRNCGSCGFRHWLLQIIISQIGSAIYKMRSKLPKLGQPPKTIFCRLYFQKESWITK